MLTTPKRSWRKEPLCCRNCCRDVPYNTRDSVRTTAGDRKGVINRLSWLAGAADSGSSSSINCNRSKIFKTPWCAGESQAQNISEVCGVACC